MIFLPAVATNWDVNLNNWVDSELESCMTDAAENKIKVLKLPTTKLPMLSYLGKDFKP